MASLGELSQFYPCSQYFLFFCLIFRFFLLVFLLLFVCFLFFVFLLLSFFSFLHDVYFHFFSFLSFFFFHLFFLSSLFISLLVFCISHCSFLCLIESRYFYTYTRTKRYAHETRAQDWFYVCTRSVNIPFNILTKDEVIWCCSFVQEEKSESGVVKFSKNGILILEKGSRYFAIFYSVVCKSLGKIDIAMLSFTSFLNFGTNRSNLYIEIYNRHRKLSLNIYA